MMELLTSPEAWVALLTLTALEIVLGIDNVIFISVIVSRIPPEQAKRARQIGLLLALVFRIILLSLLVWLIGLTEPVVIVRSVELSWRDIILIAGGAFLIAKATHEIHAKSRRAMASPIPNPKPAYSSGRSCRSSSSTWCFRWTPSSPRSAWRRIWKS